MEQAYGLMYDYKRDLTLLKDYNLHLDNTREVGTYRIPLPFNGLNKTYEMTYLINQSAKGNGSSTGVGHVELRQGNTEIYSRTSTKEGTASGMYGGTFTFKPVQYSNSLLIARSNNKSANQDTQEAYVNVRVSSDGQYLEIMYYTPLNGTPVREPQYPVPTLALTIDVIRVLEA